MSEATHQPASFQARKFMRLVAAPGVGPILCRRLLEAFGDIDQVFQASRSALQRVKGIGPDCADAIRRAASNEDDSVQRELDAAAERGVRILCCQDPDYPASLKQIPDPPICLYVRGTVVPADELAVAIVGSRRHTHYGMEQSKRFGYALANLGLTVVSGMARGIDSFAHLGALEAGGRTLAVLGCGLATVYPPENKDLHDRIAERGAVLSELPMGTPPESNNFPPRNRIIVGLSLGVIVIEATERSGAKISARLANEYNREVFALPGRVDSPNSAGPNALIRDAAAKLVVSPEDVLDELGGYAQEIRSRLRDVSRGDDATANRSGGDAELSEPRITPSLTADEEKVFAVLDLDGLDPDRIARLSGLQPSVVASTLVTLQLKSLVKRLPGDTFIRVTRRGKILAVSPNSE